MAMDIITSRHNPAFKSLIRTKKDKSIMCLEGKRLIVDALSRGIRPRMAVSTPEQCSILQLDDIPHMIISKELFCRIADTISPQGVLAFFDMPWADLSDILEYEKIIILDRLQDPGNVGTIVRTAEAFGFQAVIVLSGTASPFSSKAIRASMGSCLGIKIVQISPQRLIEIPHRIVSMASRGETTISPGTLTGKVAICMGQEGMGVSDEIMDMSHSSVYIPMKGSTESLNVAVAAGIVMACASGLMA